LNSKYLRFVSLRGASRYAGIDVTLGSVAAWLQSILGNVGAHNVFAYLQSAAMGGYKVTAVNGIMQACAMISEVAITYSSLARRTK